MKEIRAMSPGKLGHGFPRVAIAAGLEYEPDFIAADGGSGDPGPYYFGSGHPFYHPHTVREDLRLLIEATRSRDIPLILGNVLSTGTDALLQEGVRMVSDIARELGIELKVAAIHAEQSKEDLQRYLREGRIEPLAAPHALAAADIAGATVVLAQMGIEPIAAALETGAQVVLGGRACDDAVIAAMPVQRGFDRGLALHMGKILECGSMACEPGDLDGPLVGFLGPDGFVLDPPERHRVCTVDSVAAEALYEREDPYLQPGPGGVSDLRQVRFEQLDARRVRVNGGRWIPADVYKVKLEGVRFSGYRTITIAGVRDPILIGCLDEVLAKAQSDCAAAFPRTRYGYQVAFRQYGRDAVMRDLEPRKAVVPHEVGLLVEVVADTAELSEAILMFVRGRIQHSSYPGILATAGNLAYPFSPFAVPCGPAYEFHIDHLLAVPNGVACFETEVQTVGKSVAAVGTV